MHRRLMVSYTALLAVLGAAYSVAADDSGLVISHYDQLAVDGCTALIAKNALYFKKTDKAGFCNVKNQPALGTMAHCLRDVPNPKAVDRFLQTCEPFDLTLAQFDAAFDNATDFLVTNTTQDPTFNLTNVYDKPVKLASKKVVGAYDSEVGRYINFNWATWFGTALVGYWFAVVLLAGLYRAVWALFPGVVKRANGKCTNWVRRHVTLAPLGRLRHAQSVSYSIFSWVVPTRVETLVFFGWFLMAVLFVAMDHKHDSPNLFWPYELEEIGRKIADRSGIMALFLMPTVILFAGRNNFLQWISGWSFSRFLVLHRWVARTLFLLCVLHGVGMTYNGKGAGKYFTRNAQAYVRWGYTALVAMSILMVQSLMVIRRKFYELFLAFHIILSVIFVVGIWHHAGATGEGYIQWLYAAVAVWAFDRLVRFARLAAFGVQKAHVRLLANETLKVTIPRPAYWRPYPGAHAFIHFLRPTCFWQSHPFTIVDLQTEKNTLVFYLKVKGGMTHGLYRYLSKQMDNSAPIRVMVEGPYGLRIPLRHYSSLVLIAGGTGIPGLYSEALDILKTDVDQRIKLYWIVRHYQSIEWFYEELQALRNTRVEPVVYVTQAHLGLGAPIGVLAELGDADADSLEKTDSVQNLEKTVSLDKFHKSDSDNLQSVDSVDHVRLLQNQLDHVQFREGRPDIDAVVRQEIADAGSSIGFVTCAHHLVVDDTRLAVRSNLVEGKRVELFEKLQMW